MKRLKTAILVLLLVLSSFSLASAQVNKPEELKFPPLKFEPPNPARFRVVLANGLRAYIREERALPIVNITAVINTGGLYLPKEKAGLDELLSECLIKGGTKTRTGQQIEERIDFLGGTLNFSVGERTATLSMSVLSKDLDEGLDIFFDVLMNPNSGKTV